MSTPIVRPRPPLPRSVRALLTLAATACLLGAAVSYKATVVIGDVSQRDRNRPVYQTFFPRRGDFETSFNPPDADMPPGMTAMRVVTAKGQVMRCLLPEPEHDTNSRRNFAGDDTTGTEATSSADAERRAAESRFKGIDSLLKDYENKCFLRLEGWWTYEFCFGRHVIQKHIIPTDREPHPDEKEDIFVLGKYDRDADLQRRTNPAAVSTPDAAFTQLFTNGSECDMTDKQRRVLVKYICRDDAIQLGIGSSGSAGRGSAGAGSAGRGSPPPASTNKASAHRNDLTILSAVREVESCVYEVEFMNGAICNHPTYQEKMAKAARPIHCSVVHGEGPFEGLRSPSYRKATLSL